MDVYDAGDGRPDPPHLSIGQRVALVIAALGGLCLLVGTIMAEDQHNRIERELARAAVVNPP